MSRQARQKSESGIYHIMLRGINQQQIFEDPEDCIKFLELLKHYKALCGYELYAYCLMGNHVHLLLKTINEDLEQIFKRLGSSYVYWYNWKYRRKGHLFQDRYKSEPVEDDSYFLTVLRYIHQNPVKAGFCRKPEDYMYSSYREYINQKENQLTDTGFAFSMVNSDEFIRYSNIDTADKCLELEENDYRISDEEAQSLIFSVSGCDNISEFQRLSKDERNKYLHQLKENGLSIRQLSRLTGISFGIVRNM